MIRSRNQSARNKSIILQNGTQKLQDFKNVMYSYLDMIQQYEYSMLEEVDKYQTPDENSEQNRWLQGYKQFEQTTKTSKILEQNHGLIQNRLKDMKDTVDQLFQEQNHLEKVVRRKKLKEIDLQHNIYGDLPPNKYDNCFWNNKMRILLHEYVDWTNITIRFVIFIEKLFQQACCSPDSKTLLIAINRGQKQLIFQYWNLKTNSLKRQYDITSDYQLNTMQYSFDSKYILTVDLNFTLRIWTQDSQTYLSQIISEERIFCAQFSPTKYQLIIQTFKEISIWDVSNIRTPFQTSVLKLEGYQFSYSPNGQFIGIISVGNIRIWNLQTGKQIKQFKFKKNYLTEIKFTKDSRSIVIALEKGMYKTINLRNPKCIYQLYTGSKVGSWTLLAHSYYLADYCEQNVHIWNLHTKHHTVLKGTETAYKIIFTADGRYLIAAQDHDVKIFNLI